MHLNPDFLLSTEICSGFGGPHFQSVANALFYFFFVLYRYCRKGTPVCSPTNLQEKRSLSPWKNVLKINSFEFSAVQNICMFYRLCVGKAFLLNDLVAYVHSRHQYATTFGFQMTLQTIYIPCNAYWSKWPKTFCGRCMLLFSAPRRPSYYWYLK